MQVRTFALCASLGVVGSVTAALLAPTSYATARGPSSTPSSLASGLPPGDPDVDGHADGRAHFVEGKTLVLDGRLGRASIDRVPGGAADTLLLATVRGADRVDVDGVAGRGSPPVHLALVVDRSGSMAGPKMTNAVAAAIGTVERMRDGDRVTVVAFDGRARVIVPPTVVGNSARPGIETAIRGAMHAGGDTCISCALETATEQLDSAAGGGDEIKRVVLISDGEATSGVVDVAGLRALAARAREHGMSVSTIGVDLAFDEKVMAAIAQESNGRHWFVPDPQALPQIFAQEFASLETAVASRAELAIDPAPGSVVDEVLDRSFRREGRRVVVPLGAFDAGEEKTVLLRMHVQADADGVEAVAKVALAYRDVLERQDAGSEGDLSVRVRSDGAAQRELDPFVAARFERALTTRTLTEANDLFERGRLDEARAALAHRQNDLARAARPALAAASALPQPARGAARPVQGDFDAQESALAQAQSGFAGGSGSSIGGPPAAAPAAKSAVRRNQANAVDLAF